MTMQIEMSDALPVNLLWMSDTTNSINCIISIIFIKWQIIDLVPGPGTIYAIYNSCLFKLDIFSDND